LLSAFWPLARASASSSSFSGSRPSCSGTASIRIASSASSRFLQRSIGATRAGLGLDGIDVESYAPTGRFSPAEIPRFRDRLANVLIWDSSLLEARMRHLVTDTPYYEPKKPTYDVVRVHRRRQLTIASARELDIRRVEGGRTWSNDRLGYTHGLGLTRFSGTDVRPNRQPSLLDAGLGVQQPRHLLWSPSAELAEMGRRRHPPCRGRHPGGRRARDALPLRRHRWSRALELDQTSCFRARAGQQAAPPLGRDHARVAPPPPP
jgi:hypothetical protein